MIKRLFISLTVLLTAVLTAPGAPKGHLVEGCVLEAETQVPVIGAAVKLGDDYLWAITDAEGCFICDNVPQGDFDLEVSCLGYVTVSAVIDVQKDVEGLTFTLHENSLALDEVVVTAQKAKDGLGTTQSIGRDALNHLQLSNTTDIAALLPGGKTVNPDLTSENAFSLREGGAKGGNAAFGTAVEVDGVRLGNNASFGEMGGTDTRNVAVENIESIEVITGVPSAEYGDLNSGMVKINTRKGRTPVNVTFAVNPRTYTDGLKFTFKNEDGQIVVKTSPSNVAMDPGKVANLGTIGTLEFPVPEEPETPASLELGKAYANDGVVIWLDADGKKVTATKNGSAVNLPYTANEGDVIVVEVTPNDGYTFEGWADGNTDNPRTITMTADVVLSAQCVEVVQPPVGNYIQFEDKAVEAILSLIHI